MEGSGSGYGPARRPPTGVYDAIDLAADAVQEARRHGKQHLVRWLTDALVALRDVRRGDHDLLDAFFESALDKHEARYWNRSYLALPLLELLVDGRYPELAGRRALGQLVADVVRFELHAASEATPPSDLGHPDARGLRTRLRHCVRLLAAFEAVPPAAADAALAALGAGADGALADVVASLPPPPQGAAAVWLHATVLPVSTVHDEYFFIRALQAHELSFTSVADAVARATRHVRSGDVLGAAAHVERAADLLDAGDGLFRLVATMRPVAFHTFRTHTDGASAIQSEQYKRFELLCGEPPEARLRSEAFANVPTVQELADTDPDTLTTAYLDARAAAGTDGASARLGPLEHAMGRLEHEHHRWKSTHVTLAERMLGDARGSGYTAGVGYLQQWVEHRLFWRLDEGVVLAGARRRPRPPRT